jgi:ribose transport system permease protein
MPLGEPQPAYAGPPLEGASRRARVGETLLYLARTYSFAFSLVLTVALLVANLVRETGSFGWTGQLAFCAPLAIAAVASTPAIISGGGGFDLSISPLMITISAVFIVYLAPHELGGAVAVPIMLAIGLAVGLINGLVIVLLRVQPIVATLAMYFILIGVSLRILPSPASVSQTWMTHLAGSVGPIPGALFTICAPLVIWFALSRLPYLRQLYAVGSNDATAFSAGVNVGAVRVCAYALGGLFAGIGAIAVIAVGSSASASLATTYTLPAIASVALGGTSLAGGRGGLIGSVLGAASLYLLGTLLITLQVDPAWLQVVYGVMLVIAVVLVGLSDRTQRRKA